MDFYPSVKKLAADLVRTPRHCACSPMIFLRNSLKRFLTKLVLKREEEVTFVTPTWKTPGLRRHSLLSIVTQCSPFAGGGSFERRGDALRVGVRTSVSTHLVLALNEELQDVPADLVVVLIQELSLRGDLQQLRHHSDLLSAHHRRHLLAIGLWCTNRDTLKPQTLMNLQTPIQLEMETKKLRGHCAYQGPLWFPLPAEIPLPLFMPHLSLSHQAMGFQQLPVSIHGPLIEVLHCAMRENPLCTPHIPILLKSQVVKSGALCPVLFWAGSLNLG
ncbi:hypothetical protein EYF80_046049 [Liparis tanakae]|uniref:Uncharacterized protein n=1 Tax=Liparis tanakae TaxID=230148 RepID=A0A4Z2FRJ8_9TELE|nr:hypothetical protein EYF80_046049 [Liparis tanakae]